MNENPHSHSPRHSRCMRRHWSRRLRNTFHPCRYDGFTLIELSIVLVIIGLVLGGVLVGQSLIKAAEVRATITQVEKYNTAVNTFYGKYAALPGDIKPAQFTQFGFTAAPGRSGAAGQGDGNGFIDGYNYQTNTPYDLTHAIGEQAWFWEDLSTNAGLIEGGFNSFTATAGTVSGCCTGSLIRLITPAAKIGNNNYFIIQNDKNHNYFTLSAITSIAGGPGTPVGDTAATPGLTVQQAYAIDMKIDDGNPQTGHVTAKYGNQTLAPDVFSWAAGGGVAGASPGTPVSGSPTTCYDNNGIATNPMAYSVTQNNGSGVNCALSFQFQGGD